MINNITGFHIEPTDICMLKCAGCARTQFINQWPQHWKNNNINIDNLMQFLDVNLSGLTIILCGVYGDPIYHPEFHKLIRKLKDRGAYLEIVTNGSYKDHDWWTTTSEILTHNDSIVFSIDGTPDNFTEYRKNADWKSIETGISIMTKSKCHTVWKFIPFSFNQHVIDAAQQLSIRLGINEFKVELSDRFDKNTQYLIPDTQLLGKRYFSQTDFKKGVSVTVNPKCKSGRQHFISADGYYVSCCYVKDHRFYYKTVFGKKQNIFSISNTTITQLLQQPDTIEFYETMTQITACQFNCPNTK
jgi:organic radical activating enzyme